MRGGRRITAKGSNNPGRQRSNLRSHLRQALNQQCAISQRSSLVTLSEINITPLLDLAFVLLIIFVITTPFADGPQAQTQPGWHSG